MLFETGDVVYFNKLYTTKVDDNVVVIFKGQKGIVKSCYSRTPLSYVVSLYDDDREVIADYGLLSINRPVDDVEEDDNDNNDAVNHPSHYTSGKFETIDILKDKLSPEEFKGFCKGNVLKYVIRSDHKHETPIEDLEKAQWYLNTLIVTLKENN